MPRGRPRKTYDPATIAAAADRAKFYAEHWERKASKAAQTDDDRALARLKAGHWRILEKEIRSMADKPKSERR